METSPHKDLPQLPNENLSEKEITLLLFTITGQIYTFAVASDTRWGENGQLKTFREGQEGFYQLMPHRDDDGFFDWYCEERSEYQYFETMGNAALHFIYYWKKWDMLGKPQV